jgi:hypothetical protein
LTQRLLATLVTLLASSVALSALAPELLQSVDAIPAHIAGRFREPHDFGQSHDGHFLVFDRRAHTVYGIDEAMTRAWPIIEIGAEPGRILEPTAFAVAPDGSFVVADSPRGHARVQVFSPAGLLLEHFLLPGPAKPRLTLDGLAANGLAAVQFTGRSILISQPEWGSLITEYSPQGVLLRSFGHLRPTGHEPDSDVHTALNTGIPLAVPDGGYFFVFQAGVPVIRRYDAAGRLLFERQMQGTEIDGLIASLPDRWPRGTDELPVVRRSVRAAAVDADGRLWVSLAVPYTYVFDRDGDKLRVLQLRAGGIVSPTSMVFGDTSQLLVTPGLLVFDPAAKTTPAPPLDTIIMQPRR